MSRYLSVAARTSISVGSPGPGTCPPAAVSCAARAADSNRNAVSETSAPACMSVSFFIAALPSGFVIAMAAL